MSDWVDVTERIRGLLSKTDYYVYRVWGADGECLYVGKTWNLDIRFASHKSSLSRRVRGQRRSEWLKAFTRVDARHFASAADALEFERSEIRRLRPDGNVMGNIRDRHA